MTADIILPISGKDENLTEGDEFSKVLIFPGNAFQSSYLPGRYREICCFQVKGASHTIDSTGWTTTLAGQLRVGLREVETKDSGPLTAAQIKANIEAHNKSVKLLEDKRRILANPLTGTISGEENYQNIRYNIIETK